MPPLAFRMLRISGSYGTLEEFRELVELVKSGMDLSIPITRRPLMKPLTHWIYKTGRLLAELSSILENC